MSSRRRPDSQPSSARRRRSNAAPASDSTPTDNPDEWVPDSDLFLDGIDTAAEASSPMAGVGVPAVVAVVATRNAGERLDSLLASLAGQEYANLVTLIVDAGSTVDPTERVAEILPSAFVKRIDSEKFADAANAALGTVDGASFYLFLHDDVELGPGTVQAMVEEAFRSNAGIVGAKIVQGVDPTKIETVGAAIDKFGFLWPIAETGELDQSQHDAIREAFVVSSAAMLIRCDLFRDLGGFSTDIDGSGEDLDLCWRARVAGARTVVMPAATVVHHHESGY
ncbi:MAG: glycosyltransferase family 2 protein, partial [Actinobacteria bacterium]|nr:glycosyltransferase family 2 protein [Actinomycetota bacterium]